MRSHFDLGWRTRFRGWLVTVAVLMSVSVPPSAPAQEPEEDGPNIAVAEYRERRDAVLKRIDDGIVVLLGTRDEEFGEFVKFRQKNDLMYLTGASQPDVNLILVPETFSKDGRSREILFLPPSTPFTEQWLGRRIGPGPEAVARYGIAETLPTNRFQATLEQILQPSEADQTAPPPPRKIYMHLSRGREASLTREGQLSERLNRQVPNLEFAGIASIVASLRKVKSPAEIALLQKAIDITGEAQRDAAWTVRPGAFEYEVQAALEAAFTRNGAERPGFFSIVGSGPNSTVLHYHDNRRRMREGELVVVDIGAEFHYYTADITRTFPVSGTFSARQREIYQLVLEAQRAAERSFVPGQSSISSLDAAARQAMRASSLRDSQGQTLDRHFRHGLGHLLGMDVHDVGGGGPLPVGAVFTIEPGIYLADERIGVRIEDDYLVTESGLVKLSRHIPSEADAIERLMARAPSAVGVPR